MSRTAARLNTVVFGGLIGVFLLMSGFAPVASAQKRASQTARRSPQLKTPQTRFNQAYQKGYGNGLAQGAADWSANVPRGFRGSERWRQRDAGSSEEYRQGYDLGFELGYTDGYYGRTRNAAVPRNAELLAKAAALADRQRASSVPDDNRQREVNRPRASGPLVV